VPEPEQSMTQTLSFVQLLHSAGQLELPGGTGSGPHGALPPTPAVVLLPPAFIVLPPALVVVPPAPWVCAALALGVLVAP